ncbi:STAS-like domain-containing protein [Phascolarctobacterium succinatutens]|uniref:STAS-like domain-containing protein n=1 Tax=Phascolarctobacterium succinatutens TaxID=626940 RepID=UPI0026EA78A9|nr:STAS-like domain-containing protein [Phascolarctobacterium succinatutens]
MTILVKDIVGSETAIAYDDGVKCLDLVLESLEKDGSVELDFQGVEFVITAFLNPVIGDLIIKKGPDIMQKVKITNATRNIIDKIKIVKDGALIKREDLVE